MKIKIIRLEKVEIIYFCNVNDTLGFYIPRLVQSNDQIGRKWPERIGPKPAGSNRWVDQNQKRGQSWILTEIS